MSPVHRGEPWGTPVGGPVQRIVTGADSDLARWVAAPEGAPTTALVEYHPDATADLARAIGLGPAGPSGLVEVAVDALRVEPNAIAPTGVGIFAVNAVTLGVTPDRLRRRDRARSVTVTVDGRPAFSGRATGVVVANGQFLRGLDLVPRGHPGDGRLEVQVYALEGSERRAMRRRLATGTHVPHPRIIERAGRTVEVVTRRPQPLEVDGVEARCRVSHLRVELLPGALRILA